MKVINKILYEETVRYFRYFVLALLLALAIVGLDALAPWPFKVLIDNVLEANPLSNTPVFGTLFSAFNSRELLGMAVVFIYFTSTFLLSLLEYLSPVVTKKFVKQITADFTKRAFDNLQTIAIGFYKKQEIGDYIYRLSYDVSALGDFFEEGVLQLITSSLYLVTTAVIMFFIDPKLTFISLVALPFLTFGLYRFGKDIAFATKISEKKGSTVISFIEETLTHLKVIQAFSQEHREAHRFGKKIDTSLKTDIKLQRLTLMLNLLVGIIIAISYSVIIGYGIRSVFLGHLTAGLLIVFVFYLDNLTNPLLNVIYATSMIRENYVKISRMKDFFTQKRQTVQGGAVKKIEKTNIEFRRVCVKGDGEKDILHNVSFAIPEGSRTVILGANGSGKTTLFSLILGFIDKPDRGTITIGGTRLEDYDIQSVRDAISYIPQEITLFNDTIKTNIAFGSPESSLEDVVQAAKLANADEFIRKLPQGYHFRVGEAGNYLSGGQRQKLMLARAFLRKGARLLLFDEVFSALDIKSRTEILKNIYAFSVGKTTLLVSNIFSIVSAADYVVVLNDGKVVFSGKSQKLKHERSLYRLLVEIK